VYRGRHEVEIVPGTVAVGSYNDLARLFVLLPAGTWHVVYEVQSQRALLGMSSTAREWLALPREARIARAIEDAAKTSEERLTDDLRQLFAGYHQAYQLDSGRMLQCAQKACVNV